MAGCSYIIKLNKSDKTIKLDSYALLLDYLEGLLEGYEALDSRAYSSLPDLVFSKKALQDALLEKLINVKKEAIAKATTDKALRINTLLSGEPDYEVGDTISISNYLDHPDCTVDGIPVVLQLRTEDYLNHESTIIARDLKKQGIPEDEAKQQADQKVQTMVDNWEVVLQDGIALHNLVSWKYIGDVQDHMSEFEELARSHVSDTMQGNTPLIDKLYKLLDQTYMRMIGSIVNHKVIRNLTVTGTTKDGTKLSGHFDYIIIGDDGVLHVYNFKTSSTKAEDWSKAKEEKYKYTLAFLKLLLDHNGICTTNIDLNLIPILLLYNEDFTKVEDIIVHKPKSYNLGTGRGIHSDYFTKARAIILGHYVPAPISSSLIENADKINKCTFPTLNVHALGIARSAKEWIRLAPDGGSDLPLIIKEINEPDHAYDVIINGTVHLISNPASKNTNQEIRELVEQHVNELDENKGTTTLVIKDALRKSIKEGFPTFDNTKHIYFSAGYLGSIFSEYISAKTKNGESKWELLEDVLDSNVFLFRNKETGQIDVITLSSYDLNALALFRKGATNLLGAYKMNSLTNMPTGDYGNIEVTRTLVLLNEILPSLNMDNLMLGTVKVISPIKGGHSRSYDINWFTKQYFKEIFSTVKQENLDLQIINNLAKADYIDPVQSVLDAYHSIINGMAPSDIETYNALGFAALDTAESAETKRAALQVILLKLQDLHFKNINHIDRIEEFARNGNNKTLLLAALLYLLVSKAYHRYAGEDLLYLKDLSSIDYYMFTAPTIPDPNIRIVVNNLQTTLDAIASEVDDLYNEHLRPFIMQYYKDINYTPTQNATIGNQAMQYEHMYALDPETGQKTMSFKNPYSDVEDLTNSERVFLKKALYLFGRVRFADSWRFEGIDDPELIKYIQTHPEYLWVPLERASNATARQKGTRIKSAFKNIAKVITHPKDWYDEFVEGLTSVEKEQLSTDFEMMQLRNPFNLTYNQRLQYINKYGADFFETNVENLLVDYLAKAVEVEKLNLMLVGTKSLLLLLHLMGKEIGTNDEVINKEIKYIKDYLKRNVFRRPIMEPTGLKIMSVLMPIRTAVTHANLAGNLVSYFRDSFNGYYENFSRALFKFQTDISVKDVKEAYDYVITHGITNAMNVSVLSKLCVKYRLANMDLARIPERLKSGRGGIFNAENWAYATLRSPDFVNRMVLFVALCKHDGCWEAFSIDEDDNLVYDWTKDKRYEHYAKDEVDHPEYAKLRAAYLSFIREWNKQHPSNTLTPFDEDGKKTALPAAYTDKEILSIKNVANNIYGSYDKSLKAMAENTALGLVYGMYTTWMNGMWNNWMMKPGSYEISLRKEIPETDDSGNILYFDESGGVTTEAKAPDGSKRESVKKHEPMIVLGIRYTFQEMFGILMDKETGGWQATKDYIKASPLALLNLRKAISDALIALFFLALFKLALDLSYTDYKKEMKNNPVITNLTAEILYKSASRSYDSFLGPLNLINHFGENMNSPIYLVPTQTMINAGKWIFGDKDFMLFMTGSFGFGRAYRDTYNAYLRSKQ